MFAAQHLPYNQTNSFTNIVIDYLNDAPQLRPFYSFRPDMDGIQKAIQQEQLQKTDRNTLVQVLNDQYSSVQFSDAVKQNIDSLLSPDTFTVCTAHQPNLFTGPLYFAYKILHTIKLAEQLKKQLPQYNFVPVYYMGSEDADLAELNHITVWGKKYEWQTDQKGAVGRMFIDKKLLALIDGLESQLGIEPYGKEIAQLLRSCYQLNTNIQSATFKIVNELFGKYGLIVLIADDVRLKRLMLPVFEEDIFHQKPSQIVSDTSKQLNEVYNAQAYPREINLFYLKDNIRERIISINDHFVVHNTDLRFTAQELKQELNEHPERFSPNVILRGLYQETILPNIAFIGGGGELAYWLQLKDLFHNYNRAYPLLILRNSFLLIEKKWQEKINKLGLSAIDLFQSEFNLMRLIVEKNSANKIYLNGNFEKADALFEQIREQAGSIDPTLSQHVAAIKARSLKTLQELEKKMLRAEKRKFTDQQSQIQKIKEVLFPKNGLQERVENLSSYYAKWGSNLIDELYKSSLTLEQKFSILIEH
jgi:bacillithiol biosynthesis cysteine-adding enzyme BshC